MRISGSLACLWPPLVPPPITAGAWTWGRPLRPLRCQIRDPCPLGILPFFRCQVSPSPGRQGPMGMDLSTKNLKKRKVPKLAAPENPRTGVLRFFRFSADSRWLPGPHCPPPILLARPRGQEAIGNGSGRRAVAFPMPEGQS